MRNTNLTAVRLGKIILASLVIVMATTPAGYSQADAVPTMAPSHFSASSVGSIADTISTATGAAISPLLVVGTLGAWKYFRAEVNDRGNLPWFCHPAVWGLALFFSGLLLLKTTGKLVIPAPLAAPLDAVDHLARHTAGPVSGIGVALPISVQAINSFGALVQPREGIVTASLLPLTSIPAWGVTFAVTLFVFTVVWMSFNAVDTLVMLCPFGPVEFVSKLIKGAVLLLILVLTLFSPILALVFCGLIIAIATKVAGWAYRITIFGFVLMYDLLMPGSARKRIDVSAPHAFVKCKSLKIPARTYGRIASNNGVLIFQYKPVFFAPRRAVSLPNVERYIVKGLLMSGIHDAQKTKELCKISFPPRYKKHEEAIAASLGFTDIRDCSLVRGWKAMKLWFADTFLGKSVELPRTMPTLLPPTVRYFLFAGTDVTGPYDVATLRAMWRADQLPAGTSCCLEGAEEWQDCSVVLSSLR
jgi:hypothetical protein